jgi:hypothetical protein
MVMINMGLGSFVRSRKAVKASRASLNGIAGHQAAMKALGNQMSRKSRDRMSSENIAKRSVQIDSDNASRNIKPITVDNSPESKIRVTHSIDNLAAKYAEEGPL